MGTIPTVAPGAVGTNPCTDIPFLRMYQPNGEAAVTTVGIIVMPGGGYNELIDKDEQAPVAKHFANKLGITTFALYHRLVEASVTYRYPVPMWDAQRTVRKVRANAAQYGIDPSKIGVFGFPAGGHRASTMAIHFDTSFGDTAQDSVDSTDPRPDFMGLGYPVISMDPNQLCFAKFVGPSAFGIHGNPADAAGDVSLRSGQRKHHDASDISLRELGRHADLVAKQQSFL